MEWGYLEKHVSDQCIKPHAEMSLRWTANKKRFSSKPMGFSDTVVISHHNGRYCIISYTINELKKCEFIMSYVY